GCGDDARRSRRRVGHDLQRGQLRCGRRHLDRLALDMRRPELRERHLGRRRFAERRLGRAVRRIQLRRDDAVGEQRRHGDLGHQRRSRHGRLGHRFRRHGRVGHQLQQSRMRPRDLELMGVSASPELAWTALPPAARVYVAAVIALGTAAFVTFLPQSLGQPALFGALLLFVYLPSIWKVNLPLALANGSTLSVAYAADLTALLVLGPRQAMAIAMVGALTQCTRQPRQRYPWYRTLFSIAVFALTMRAVAEVYAGLGGIPAPATFAHLPKALVGITVTCFTVNTALVAGAIGLATRQRPWSVWRDHFLWSGPSFIVAGTAGALAAVV